MQRIVCQRPVETGYAWHGAFGSRPLIERYGWRISVHRRRIIHALHFRISVIKSLSPTSRNSSATSPAPGVPAPNDYWFNGSLAWEPGFFMNITDNMNFELILFGRVDQNDRKRTHGDIREGFFELFFDEWTLGFGVHKVFWGVTESRHSVDIINQTDLVEDFDADIKLGQAMLTTSYTHKAGTFSLYVMSWTRPLVFPGPEGRPTLPIPVDNDIRVYQSRLKEGQIDAALRWSHAMDGFHWA